MPLVFYRKARVSRAPSEAAAPADAQGRPSGRPQAAETGAPAEGKPQPAEANAAADTQTGERRSGRPSGRPQTAENAAADAQPGERRSGRPAEARPESGQPEGRPSGRPQTAETGAPPAEARPEAPSGRPQTAESAAADAQTGERRSGRPRRCTESGRPEGRRRQAANRRKRGKPPRGRVGGCKPEGAAAPGRPSGRPQAAEGMPSGRPQSAGARARDAAFPGHGFPNPKDLPPQELNEPLIMLDGKLLPNVLLVNTFIGGGPDKRKAWHQAMGIPVIYTLSYRHGDRAAYMKDTAGVNSFMLPFTLTMSEYIGMQDPVMLYTNEGGELRAIPEQTRHAGGQGGEPRAAANGGQCGQARGAAVLEHARPARKISAPRIMNVPRSIEQLIKRSEGGRLRLRSGRRAADHRRRRADAAPAYRHEAVWRS